MPEATSNVEFAHKIHEQSHHASSPGGRREEWVEIFEAIVLAIVAVMTAWSGYQAAKWDAKSAEDYALASRTTVMAQEKATLAGQDHLYDVTTFQAWVDATVGGQPKLAQFYERRFRSEFVPAFEAWMKLSPLTNASAPPGPTFMPEYKSALAAQSAVLSEQANGYFEKGVSTRETGDQFVRITVVLATVLLLTALSQRFKVLGPRVAIVSISAVLLVYSVYLVAMLPQA
jgi:hypothetical protein